VPDLTSGHQKREEKPNIGRPEIIDKECDPVKI